MFRVRATNHHVHTCDAVFGCAVIGRSTRKLSGKLKTVNTHSTSCSTSFCINKSLAKQETVKRHATLEVEAIYFG